VVEGAYSDRPFGVLAAFSRRSGAFTEADASFVQSVANVVSAALEHERDAARLAFLAEASQLLAGPLGVRETMQRIAELVAPRLADWCTVDLSPRGDQGWTSIVWHADPARRERGSRVRSLLPADAAHGAPRVLRTGRAEFFPEVTGEHLRALAPSAEAMEAARELPLRSILCVPLTSRGAVLGALTLATERRRLDEADLSVAEDLARRAGLALDTAWLYEEARRAVALRDEVLGIVSHDLRSPLGAITLAATTVGHLVERGADPARTEESLEVIRRSAERMERLIGDLLDTARVRAGRLPVAKQVVDLREVVKEAVAAEADATAAARLALRTDLPEEPVRASCDRDRVLQVLANLIGNARRFTPEGGSVSVRLRADPRSAVLEVSDTGPGIGEEDARHVFEPFWTRRRGHGRAGSGLGLFIARGIVESHGGSLTLESAPGRGTLFRVQLPFDADE
jgi:signal transduction histidine kinase